jgi:hypothetical protein
VHFAAFRSERLVDANLSNSCRTLLHLPDTSRPDRINWPS